MSDFVTPVEIYNDQESLGPKAASTSRESITKNKTDTKKQDIENVSPAVSTLSSRHRGRSPLSPLFQISKTLQPCKSSSSKNSKGRSKSVTFGSPLVIDSTKSKYEELAANSVTSESTLKAKEIDRSSATNLGPLFNEIKEKNLGDSDDDSDKENLYSGSMYSWGNATKPQSKHSESQSVHRTILMEREDSEETQIALMSQQIKILRDVLQELFMRMEKNDVQCKDLETKMNKLIETANNRYANDEKKYRSLAMVVEHSFDNMNSITATMEDSYSCPLPAPPPNTPLNPSTRSVGVNPKEGKKSLFPSNLSPVNETSNLKDLSSFENIDMSSLSRLDDDLSAAEGSNQNLPEIQRIDHVGKSCLRSLCEAMSMLGGLSFFVIGISYATETILIGETEIYHFT